MNTIFSLLLLYNFIIIPIIFSKPCYKSNNSMFIRFRNVYIFNLLLTISILFLVNLKMYKNLNTLLCVILLASYMWLFSISLSLYKQSDIPKCLKNMAITTLVFCMLFIILIPIATIYLYNGSFMTGFNKNSSPYKLDDTEISLVEYKDKNTSLCEELLDEAKRRLIQLRDALREERILTRKFEKNPSDISLINSLSKVRHKLANIYTPGTIELIHDKIREMTCDPVDVTKMNEMQGLLNTNLY